jgi:hypothetical protein
MRHQPAARRVTINISCPEITCNRIRPASDLQAKCPAADPDCGYNKINFVRKRIENPDLFFFLIRRLRRFEYQGRASCQADMKAIAVHSI